VRFEEIETTGSVVLPGFVYLGEKKGILPVPFASRICGHFFSFRNMQTRRRTSVFTLCFTKNLLVAALKIATGITKIIFYFSKPEAAELNSFENATTSGMANGTEKLSNISAQTLIVLIFFLRF
jgi:hypothetical protein